MIARGTWWLTFLIAIVACAPVPSGTPAGADAVGTRTFDESGLVMTYPGTWHEDHFQVVSSFSNVIAYLGTAEVHDPCTRTESSVSCGSAFQLLPGTIVVIVGQHAFPGYDILDNPMDEGRGVLVDVGGLPARRAVTGADPDTGADEVVTWSLSMPGSVDNGYTVTGYLRGPGMPELIVQVDAMVASLRYDPAVVPLPDDPAVMQAAVRATIEASARGSVGWDCVPRGPGTAHATIAALPNGPPLAAPVGATCSVSVLATAHQLWKATVTVTPDQPIPEGVGSQVIWVAPPTPTAPSATAPSAPSAPAPAATGASAQP